jgi:hypothetical protein
MLALLFGRLFRRPGPAVKAPSTGSGPRP